MTDTADETTWRSTCTEWWGRLDRDEFRPLREDGVCGREAECVVVCPIAGVWVPKCTHCARAYFTKVMPMTLALDRKIARLQTAPPRRDGRRV